MCFFAVLWVCGGGGTVVRWTGDDIQVNSVFMVVFRVQCCALFQLWNCSLSCLSGSVVCSGLAHSSLLPPGLGSSGCHFHGGITGENQPKI